jgi:hypothetical protein
VRLNEIFTRTLEKIREDFTALIARPEVVARQKERFVGSGKAARPSNDPIQMAVEKAWAVWPMLREAVTLARGRCDLQRDALLSQLSKAWQKPDFCVRRDAAGPEAERLFPRVESWDDYWYVGGTNTSSKPERPPMPGAIAGAAPRKKTKTARKRK